MPLGLQGIIRHFQLFPHPHQLAIKLGWRRRATVDFQPPEMGKKDSGSARQGETANTATCDYPNRLNLTSLTAGFSASFEISRVFAKKFRSL